MTLGMMLLGGFLGLPIYYYPQSLYRAAANDPIPIVGGASIGLALGLFFGLLYLKSK
jgi:hypothetical protein